MLAEGAGMDQRCPDKSRYRPLALFDFDSWEHQISEGQYFRGVEQVSCLITQLSYKYFQTFFILVTTKTPVVQLCMDPWGLAAFGFSQTWGAGIFARPGSTKPRLQPLIWDPTTSHLPRVLPGDLPQSISIFFLSCLRDSLSWGTHRHAHTHTSMRSYLPAWVLMVASRGSHSDWEARNLVSVSKSVNRNPENDPRLSFSTILKVGG